MNLLNILLMGTPGDDKGGMMNIIMFGLIFVVFYFFMIRPQQKKAKEQKKFHEEVKKGDKVVTNGGIHGKIVEVKGTTFILELEAGNKMKIEQSAISLDLSQQYKK